MKSTLAHILNYCPINFQLMTDRHNRVVKCVKRAISEKIPRNLGSSIYENTPIQIDGLDDDNKRLKPDMWFFGKEDDVEIMEILEFSCPFGRSEENQSTLKNCYEQKFHKYQRLASECSRLTNKPVRVHPIIISSLGAVMKDSLESLKKILLCDKSSLNKLGTWMSEQPIMGSFKLWIDFQKRNNHDHRREEETEELTLANQVNVEEIENDAENIEDILNVEINETVELETNSTINLRL
jgi:hypothetical protein